jgi:uncharacterized protein YbjQ (UPF0145 family)
MQSIIILAVLISCGYFFGRYAEKKHYRSIKEREKNILSLPLTSSKYPIDDKKAVQQAFLVQGGVVISVDYFKRVLAALRNIFGGNVQSFETLLDRARREAILRLKESCSDADEIINLRIETSSISKGGDNKIGCVEVLAYGTAIYYTQ